MEKDFLKRIQNTIAGYKMLQPGEKAVVAVSGGADSMALLNALYRLKDYYQLSLWIAHYNHCLRGEESDKEAEFVAIQAKKLGIPLVVGVDDGSLLQKQSNLEEIARKKRYSFLQRVASEVGAQKVALGHTANDQVETFFLWVFRGAGTKGLGGIPPVREDFFVRPLIEIEERKIKAFLEKEGIPWLEDSSNQRKNYLRNRIRHFLIPKLLSEFDANLIGKVKKTTEIVRDEDLFLETVSFEKFKELKKEGKEKVISFEIAELMDLPTALRRRVLRHAIRGVKGSLRSIQFAHLEAVLEIMKSKAPNSRISLPGDLEIYREYNQLRFCGVTRGEVRFHHEFNSLPGEIWIPEIDRRIEIKVLPWDSGQLPRTNKNSALMDFDTLQFPLIARNWKEGDRFQPLGMRGLKKVKDFFIDLKLPTKERQNTPIILFGNMIAWIGGQRIDDRVKISSFTKKAIKMDVH